MTVTDTYGPTIGRRLAESGVHGWVLELDACVATVVETPTGPCLAAASRGLLRTLNFDSAAFGLAIDDVFIAGLPLSVVVSGVLQSGTSVRFTTEIRTQSGARGRFVISVRSARAGEPYVVLEATRLEEPQAMSDGRLADLFDQLSMINGGVIFIHAPDAAPGPQLAGLLGCASGVSEETPTSCCPVHPDDGPLVAAHRRRLTSLRDGEFATVVYRMRRPDGPWRWIQIRERPFGRDRRGKLKRVLAVASDVSEHFRLQHSLAAASKALLRAESDERKRIARELHDSTAQHLAAIELSLGRLQRATRNHEDSAAIIRDIHTSLTAAHREVRAFSYLLHPPEIERRGLETTLRRFIDGFAARTGLHAELDIQGPKAALKTVQRLALFRIAQEALMNVHKHAEARSVLISLTFSPGLVELRVLDDGAVLASPLGRRQLKERSGVGIAGMKARMKQIGGVLKVEARPQGLLVRAELPLPRSA